MASVVLHAFRQIGETGGMKLFRSHRKDYADGEQLRDFVYVRDVVDVCHWLMHHRKDSGLYNLGSGQARSFLDLTRATFNALGVEENIGFIDRRLAKKNDEQNDEDAIAWPTRREQTDSQEDAFRTDDHMHGYSAARSSQQHYQMQSAVPFAQQQNRARS